MISKIELKIFLTVFLVTSIFIYWSGWNENARLDLTRAILDEGRLEIDNCANNTSDRAYFNDHYYIEKSPVSSWLITPTYGTWKFIYYNLVSRNLIKNNYFFEYNEIKWNNGIITEPINLSLFVLFSYILVTIFYSVVFTSLTTVLIYKISSFYLKKEYQKLFICFIYWLGTLAFFYSLILYNHSFPTFLAFLSFYILFTMKQFNKKNIFIFISGILLGLAITSEAAVACFFIPFLLYVICLYKSKISIFLIGVIIGFSALLIYNYLIFSNPLMVTFKYIDPTLWEGSGITESFGFNSLPNFYVFLRLLIYPEKGLFFHFPVLIFSIFGFYFMLKEKKVEGLLILSMFLLILIFISMYKAWWEYNSFGPRRIFTIMPFLMLPLIFSFNKIRFNLIFLLFLVSLFVNVLSLNHNGFLDIFTLQNSFKVNPDVMKKVNTLEIIDYPLINHHFPLFVLYGPRSRLIESFLVKDHMFDIRDYWPSTNLMEEPRIFNIKLFTTPFGFVYMKTSFVTILIVAIIILLIWRKSAVRFILRYKYLFVIFYLLSLSYFFNINSVAYEKNWLQQEITNGISSRWMSDNATISVYSPIEEKVKLQFNVWTFYRNRTMEVYLNNKLIASFNMEVNKSKEFVTPLFGLNAGENTITFHSVEGCDVPAKVNAWLNDYRCLSFQFVSLEKLNLKDISNKLIFENWYDEEKYKSGNFRWMSNDANMTYYSLHEVKANMKFDILSYHKNRELNVYMNNVFINRLSINSSWNQIALGLNLINGDNIITFHSVSGCNIPARIENSTDNRCLSFAFRNVTIE